MDYCYWTVVDARYVPMAQAMVNSARAAGVYRDIHVWSPEPVQHAIHHPLERFDPTLYLFKFLFLFEVVRKLPYEHFIWLDADNYFVRNPGDVQRVLKGAPVHSTLEADACGANNMGRPTDRR